MNESDPRVAEQMRAKEAGMGQQTPFGLANATKGLGPINQACDAGGSRMSARGVLEQRYEQLLREANGIHALLQALPGSMGREAEEALWKIVVDQRR